MFGHLTMEALSKNISDLSAKLPTLPQHERKYVLGRIRGMLDELDQRGSWIKKSIDEVKEPKVSYSQRKLRRGTGDKEREQ